MDNKLISNFGPMTGFNAVDWPLTANDDASGDNRTNYYNHDTDSSDNFDEDEDEDEDDEDDDHYDDDHGSMIDPDMRLRAMHYNFRSINLEDITATQKKQLIKEYSRFIKKHCRLLPEDDKLFEIEKWNLLSKMAKEQSLTKSDLHLVKFLAESLPVLLDAKDIAHRGALLIAVYETKVDFIEAVINSDIDPLHLSAVIASPNLHEENCIHTAIKRDLSVETTIKLIQKVSMEGLMAKDKEGLTPLHRAVAYDHCTPSRRNMICTLIERSDGAFDQKSASPDFFSVYQYHVSTRKNYEKAGSEKQNRKIENTSQEKKRRRKTKRRSITKIHQQSRPDRPDERRNEESRLLDPKKLEDFPTQDPSRNGLKRMPSVKKRVIIAPVIENVDQTPGPYQANETRHISRRNSRSSISFSSPMKLIKTSSESKAAKELRNLRVSQEGSTKKEIPLAETADFVAKELKLHYFRSIYKQEEEYLDEQSQLVISEAPRRTHDSAIEFLFGENKEG